MHTSAIDSDRMLLNGAELYVAPPQGHGEPLVLIHGGWTDHTTFSAVVGGLARSFRVVRYDRRGHSLSPYGPGPSPRRRDEDDLIALIEALGEPAHLVGTSYGGCIALAVAGRRPELVRGVVAHEPPLLALAPDPPVEALFREIQDQLAAGDVEGGTRRFFEELALGPGAWGLIPARLRRASIANAQTFVDLREDPAWAHLDVDAVMRFDGPLTITRGTSSPAWARRIGAAVAERLGREALPIEGAGHSPHLTRPAALVAVVEARLAR